MKQYFKILFIFGLILFSCNMSYAQHNKWQLVKQIYFSNNTIPTYNLYVDVDDIEVNYFPNKTIESADVWAKSIGSDKDINTDNSPVVYRYHLNFANNTVDLINKVVYEDGNGNKSFPAVYGESPNKHDWTAYIYYYVLGNLTGNDEFKQYVNGEKTYITQQNDDSTSSLAINYDTVFEKSGRIYYETEFTDDKGYGFVTHLVNTEYMDLAEGKIYTTKTTYINHLNEIVVKNSNDSTFIYPDTIMEKMKNDLISYCKEKSSWVHRYDNGIEIKSSD